MATTLNPQSVSAESIFKPEQTVIASLLRRGDPMAAAKQDNPERSKEDWSTYVELVAGAAAHFFGADVGQVLVAGWKKYDALMEAGRLTRGSTAEKTVPLGGHTVTLRQHPRVDLKWGPKTLTTVHFAVVVEVNVHVVDGVVRGGSLVDLSTGTCEAEVRLETAGVKLARKSHTLDPHAIVSLGDGIPLV